MRRPGVLARRAPGGAVRRPAPPLFFRPRQCPWPLALPAVSGKRRVSGCGASGSSPHPGDCASSHSWVPDSQLEAVAVGHVKSNVLRTGRLELARAGRIHL